MDYLKSEHLKFKRTISNKLIFIVPLITAIFAWIMGGYMGYQYMTRLLVVCVPASWSNRNFVFFVTQKRRKRRKILFGIFYACKPFEI